LAVARHFEPALGIEALDGVRWPGRLERVVVGPRGGALVLDVAHNPAGMQALVDYVADQPWRDTVTIVFGCAPDKDEPAMLEVLRSLQRPLWWVPPAGPERSDGRTDRPAGDDDDRPRPQPRGIARRFAEPEDPRLVGAVSQRLAAGDTVVVCGSHLVVGPLRTHFVEPQRGTVRPDPSDPRAGGA
jgi:dihydrofolate synthase/folylpolyglutamate synthase